MRVCGIKLTRVGADALVEDGWLAFCVEQEKRGNNPRYETVDNFDAIGAALSQHGPDPRVIDQIIIDGWGAMLKVLSDPSRAPVSFQ
ncbi:6-O-carbamoyl transferase (plasmid) [Rhizobium sp. CCGE 510]|nr:6-O-carbamoyl transferase [Rhizobium sp. CCGE 510]